jgi:hypothetical protein
MYRFTLPVLISIVISYDWWQFTYTVQTPYKNYNLYIEEGARHTF